MTTPLCYQTALQLYLQASFQVIQREQASMVRMVDRQERSTREQLIRHFGEANAWRGLAPDDFQLAFDLMKAFEAAEMSGGFGQSETTPSEGSSAK